MNTVVKTRVAVIAVALLIVTLAATMMSGKVTPHKLSKSSLQGNGSLTTAQVSDLERTYHLTYKEVGDTEAKEYMLIHDKMREEMLRCDSLHIPVSIRVLHTKAINQAGEAEMARVRSSGYKSEFNPKWPVFNNR